MVQRLSLGRWEDSGGGGECPECPCPVPLNMFYVVNFVKYILPKFYNKYILLLDIKVIAQRVVNKS